MKTKVIMVAAVCIAVFVCLCSVSYAGTSDKAKAKQWAKAQYPSCKVVFVKEGSKKIDKRCGKNIVYIEVFKTRSAGGYDGWTKRGGYVKYTKKVKRSKKCTSYAIWNPFTKYCDDVVAFVDHGKIRCDKVAKVKCPYCKGRDQNCKFWAKKKHRHMTTAEIKAATKPVAKPVQPEIHCPMCGDGKDEHCVYWCGFNNGTEYRHMTDEEIADFEFTESHWQDEEGNWHVR